MFTSSIKASWLCLQSQLAVLVFMFKQTLLFTTLNN